MAPIAGGKWIVRPKGFSRWSGPVQVTNIRWQGIGNLQPRGESAIIIHHHLNLPVHFPLFLVLGSVA